MDSNDVHEIVVDILGFNVSMSTSKLIFLLAVILGAIIASHLLRRVLHGIFEKTSVPSATIFVNMVRVLVWIVALLIILKPLFGMEPSGFLTALGVTSIAISLGLQSTLANLFGGLTLMMGKIIAPGDVVTIAGVTGVIRDINWRATTLVQFNGDEQIIPNSLLSTTAFTKLEAFQAGEFALPVMLTKDADLNEVRKEIDELARLALGTYYDEAYGTPLFIREFNNFGVVASISLHAKPGITPAKVRTAMADAIYGKPWLI